MTVSQPALLTGTSSEFLGKRPTPRILRERYVVMVLGPDGAGKSSVARKIATMGQSRTKVTHLDTSELQREVVQRVRFGKWSDTLRTARGLVLDGPIWLRNRDGVLSVLHELLNGRAKAGLRTVVCQTNLDGSVEALMAGMEPGSLVVVGLRFPKGRRGRLKFAKRVCEVLEIPSLAADGTHEIEPWAYAKVIGFLQTWKAEWESQGRPDGQLQEATLPQDETESDGDSD